MNRESEEVAKAISNPSEIVKSLNTALSKNDDDWVCIKRTDAIASSAIINGSREDEYADKTVPMFMEFLRSLNEKYGDDILLGASVHQIAAVSFYTGRRKAIEDAIEILEADHATMKSVRGPDDGKTKGIKRASFLLQEMRDREKNARA